MTVFKEPTKWQTSLVNSGDANVIPQSTPAGTGKASFNDGFPLITQVPIGAGGIAPDRKDFNGLFKILGDWIFFNQNGGVPSYNAHYDYVAGRVVSYNDSIYKCVQSNGVSSTVVAPDSGTKYWQRIDNFVRSVNGVNADTKGNVQLGNFVCSVNGVNADTKGNVQLGNFVCSVNGVNADTKGNVQLGNFGVITGKIEWFAFNKAPDGYLVCNGANVSRKTYAKLFAVIGTTFGRGDNSTTFTLPNLIDRFAQGSTTVGTYKSAGLPDHNHQYEDSFVSFVDGHGGSQPLCATCGITLHKTTEKASKSNSIYGNSTTVQPPALTLLPCIKY